MDQHLDMQTIQEQTVKVSPTLIMVNQLLALSSLELQQVVGQELEANPALESVEGITCPSCGAGTTGVYCPVCMQPVLPVPSPNGDGSHSADKAPDNGSPDDDYDFDDYRRREPGAALSDEDDFDPLTLVASEMTMTEQLLSDLAVSLSPEDYTIAEYLVGNLDEQGFLGCSIEAASSELGVPIGKVEEVLTALQRTGPVGVGARDLRECLLIQLEDMSERRTGEPVPFVEEVIRNHLTELGEHKYTIIAQALDTDYENVVAVRDFIKKHMQPRPILEAPRARSWRSPTPTRFAVPDVIIHLRDGRLEPEVVEGYRFKLRINPLYQQLAIESAGSLSMSTHGHLSDGERDHIRRYVNRSKLFISNINQRRETMRRITTCLIDTQEEFIRWGVRYLKPLTRAQVAQYLGLHESTVSRATADKYVMLPNKQVVPFSDFFSASLSAKDMIREIIVKEGRPVTDKEIVNRLRELGVRVARRTVTKYRNQLGILPSTFR